MNVSSSILGIGTLSDKTCSVLHSSPTNYNKLILLNKHLSIERKTRLRCLINIKEIAIATSPQTVPEDSLYVIQYNGKYNFIEAKGSYNLQKFSIYFSIDTSFETTRIISKMK